MSQPLAILAQERKDISINIILLSMINHNPELSSTVVIITSLLQRKVCNTSILSPSSLNLLSEVDVCIVVVETHVDNVGFEVFARVGVEGCHEVYGGIVLDIVWGDGGV